MMENSALAKVQALIIQLSRWEEHITAALQHGHNTHTFDDIVGMILANRILFFSYEKAFVIMEKVTYPQFSVFHGFLAGGSMEDVMAAEEGIKAVGRELGCKYLSIAGRDGWRRQLKDRGWEHVCTTLYTPIDRETKDEWRERREGRRAGVRGQTTREH